MLATHLLLCVTLGFLGADEGVIVAREDLVGFLSSTVALFAFPSCEDETLATTRSFRLLLADPGSGGLDDLGEESTFGDTTMQPLLH